MSFFVRKSFLGYFLIIFLIVIIWQFVAGTFIRNNCDDKALELSVKAVTPDMYPKISDRNLIQGIYKDLQYQKCLNGNFLLDFGGHSDFNF